MDTLRKYMPQGYLKRVNSLLIRSVAPSTIFVELKHPGRNKEVSAAIAWVAMENILGKMLEMPSR